MLVFLLGFESHGQGMVNPVRNSAIEVQSGQFAYKFDAPDKVDRFEVGIASCHYISYCETEHPCTGQ